jgi:hypothetical protein
LPDYDVNDVASVGYIADIPGYQLPPEAWTFAENARLLNDSAGTGASWNQIFSTAGVDNASPIALQSVRTAANAQWVTYASLDQLYGWDNTNIANVSGPSAPYGTTNPWEWVGTQLAGIPIWTNNKKPPQYWTGIDLTMKYADLPSWTADLGSSASCRSLRAFGPYLVALNVTLGPGGNANASLASPVQHKHGVVWSHPADPGTMPASWNYADPTRDAGFNELNDADAGVVIDGLPLKASFYIYKESSTWVMRIVGGQYIMQFDPFLLQSGILAAHCAALTGDGKYHFVVTGDDVIIHDGTTPTSLLDKRARKALFNRISIAGVPMSHVFAVPTQREMWFCYAEQGASSITRALIWNYSGGGSGVLYESVFPYVAGAIADVASTQPPPWDSDVKTWDFNTNLWDMSARRRTIVADPIGKQVLELDYGTTRDGVAYVTTLQREALSFIAHRRLPMWDPLMDFKQRKFVRRIWPKMSGAPCNIRIGFCDTVGGSTVWGQSQSFDPNSQVYADFTVSGREAPSIEFTWKSSDGIGQLFGYKLEIFPAGTF